MEKGTIQIKTLQKTKSDPSFIMDGAVLVRFMNTGQTAVFIDEQFYLEPGESFTEGDTSGPGISHQYKIDFLVVASPPVVVAHKVFPNNHLKVRFFHRKK